MNYMPRRSFFFSTSTASLHRQAHNQTKPKQKVADFFPDQALEEVGRYSGFVVGAYFVGQLVASFLWGALADRFGRRPVLLAGTVGTMASLTLFAFSLNLWWALSGRFLWGALNGVTQRQRGRVFVFM